MTAFEPSRYENLPRVEASLHYLVSPGDKPRTYTFDPPAGIPQTTAAYEPHTVVISDVRPVAAGLSLDEEGFQLVKAHTAVEDFSDEDTIEEIYYAESGALLREHTGASRVVIFDHTVRRRRAGVSDRAPGAPRQPVPRVHNDHTEKSGPQRVRDLLGEEAEELLTRRFSIVNVWRPIRGPLRDAPLAVCDARSVEPGDFVASDLIYRDRIGETYGVKYNRRHRWFYAPEMLEDEVWLLKCYDSDKSGVARFSPHTAFEDPTAPANVLPRESIELRTLLFFDR